MKHRDITSVVYIAIVEVAEDRLFVWFPDVPGAVAGADRVDEISDRATRALLLRLVWLDQHDQPIPKARSFKQVLNDPAVRLSMKKGVDFAIPVGVEIATQTTSAFVPVAANVGSQEAAMSL